MLLLPCARGAPGCAVEFCEVETRPGVTGPAGQGAGAENEVEARGGETPADAETTAETELPDALGVAGFLKEAASRLLPLHIKLEGDGTDPEDWNPRNVPGLVPAYRLSSAPRPDACLLLRGPLGFLVDLRNSCSLWAN